MAKENVYLARVFIKSVLGIEQLLFKPGKRFTKVSGDNATGKTSIIEALKSVLGGGVHDAKLIRTGSEEATIVLDLDDGVELTKYIKAEASEIKAEHPEMGVLGKPVAYLNRIRDKVASNPVEFLTAKAADRLNILLQSIPMTIAPEKLGFVPDSFKKDIALSGHALSVIEALRKNIFERRAEKNVSIRDKEGTISTLAKAAPPEAPDGTTWKAEKLRLEAEIKKLNRSTQSALELVKTNAASAYEAGKTKHQDGLDAIDKEIDEKIRILNDERESRKGELRKAREKEVEEGTASAHAENTKIQADYKTKYDPLKTQLTTADNRVEEEIRFDESSQLLNRLQEERLTLSRESDDLSTVLEKLVVLKSDLLKEIPVAGLEVRDGDIFVDDTPFDTLNSAEQIKLAVRLCILRTGKLRLVVLDGLERLGRKNRELLISELNAADMQCIGSFVESDEDLKIEGDGVEILPESEAPKDTRRKRKPKGEVVQGAFGEID